MMRHLEPDDFISLKVGIMLAEAQEKLEEIMEVSEIEEITELKNIIDVCAMLQHSINEYQLQFIDTEEEDESI